MWKSCWVLDIIHFVVCHIEQANIHNCICNIYRPYILRMSCLWLIWLILLHNKWKRKEYRQCRINLDFIRYRLQNRSKENDNNLSEENTYFEVIVLWFIADEEKAISNSKLFNWQLLSFRQWMFLFYLQNSVYVCVHSPTPVYRNCKNVEHNAW